MPVAEYARSLYTGKGCSDHCIEKRLQRGQEEAGRAERGCCSYWVKGHGGSGWAGNSGGGELWSGSGFLLKAESMGSPDGLDVG